MQTGNKGYTMIEVLVVIFIVGLLAMLIFGGGFQHYMEECSKPLLEAPAWCLTVMMP